MQVRACCTPFHCDGEVLHNTIVLHSTIVYYLWSINHTDTSLAAPRPPSISFSTSVHCTVCTAYTHTIRAEGGCLKGVAIVLKEAVQRLRSCHRNLESERVASAQMWTDWEKPGIGPNLGANRNRRPPFEEAAARARQGAGEARARRCVAGRCFPLKRPSHCNLSVAGAVLNECMHAWSRVTVTQ